LIQKKLNLDNLQSTKPILQVELFFKSKKHLVIEDFNSLRESDGKNNLIFNNEDSSNTFIHQMVFETECKDIY
jgi:hypothetical protein